MKFPNSVYTHWFDLSLYKEEQKIKNLNLSRMIHRLK